jgi:two-component system sensor histidine kinase/response regulator
LAELARVSGHPQERFRVLDRLTEPLLRTFGSLDSLPQEWREALDALRDSSARAEQERESLIRGLERSTTELRELLVEVDALRRARATVESTNLVRGEILATVSRAMRSPTDAILGLSGLLRSGALLPTQRSYVDAVHGAADALLAILNDVSDFSRLEAGTLPLEPIPFDLRVMLEDTALGLDAPVQAKGLALRFSWRPDALRRVLGDPGRIRQIITALVLDASMRTEKGEIVVEVGRGPQCDGQSTVALVVEDTGARVPADLMHSLFEPFNRGDAYPTRNSGLPLAVSRQLARLMGGDLTAEAIPAGGMRFTAILLLPAAEPDVVPALEARAVAPAAVVPAEVLIVEADPDARAAWGAIAEAAGYHASGIASRDGVLDRLQQERDEGRGMAMVLFSDHDADGYDALGRTILTELAGDRPALLMLPAVGHPGDVRKLRQAGFLGYLVKPVSLTDLKEVLETILRIPPTERHTVFLTRHSLAEARLGAARESDLDDLSFEPVRLPASSDSIGTVKPGEAPSPEAYAIPRSAGRAGGSAPRARTASE